MGSTKGRGIIIQGALIIAFVFYVFISNSYADTHPFSNGERLTFQLRWTVIPAGEAVLEVLPSTTVHGVPAYHFRLTANSNAFVDLFFKVRDRIDAYTNLDMTHALRYRQRQHEGQHWKNILVDFDWHTGTARLINGKKEKRIELIPGAFDPLSIFYFTRMADFNTTQHIVRPVSDGNTCVLGEARIIKREPVTVHCGTFDTFLIEPDLKHVGGVFEKDKDAKIKIWVTADAYRIPVKITSRVSVGHFVGELVSMRKGTPLQAKRSVNAHRADMAAPTATRP